MKRTLLPCVLCLMALLGLQAQSENDAIYVFRNDGQFNAFFDTQVDSITYSHYDADSIWHSDWQMQVVHTIDSIYRIPLAVIDSVAFETPETVLQQGVIEIKEDLLANVISATDSTILFSSSIPYSLLPSVGKLVVTTEMSDIFPAGFAGEVVHVESTADGYLMRCVPASLEDIFETFYSVSVRPMEETRAGVVETGRCTIGPFTVLAPSPVLENLSHSVDLRDDYVIDVDPYFDMSLTTQLDVSSMVIVNKEHGTYISLNCIGNYNLWEKIAFSGALSYEKKFGKAFHSPPIPVCPFVSFYFEPGFFFKASVEGGTENEWTQHYRSVFHYEYSSRGEEVIKPINRLVPVNKTHSGETTIDGSVAIGGYVESGFAIKDKNFANVHIGAELGVKLESNAILYKDETNTCRESHETYDKLHGSGIFLNWYYGTVAEAEFLKYTATYELPWGQKGRIAQMAHVPTFTNVSITPDPTDGTKAKGSAMVIGGCFLPQSVGLLLVDDEGNEVEKVYHKDKHYMLSTTMEHTFTGLDSDKHYTLYPIVHAYGVEMLASPKDELMPSLYVCTGDAFASFTEARCWGRCSFDEDFNKKIDVMSIADECGFFYNQTGEPQNGNASKQICNMMANGLFDGTLSGLTEDTQYFYTAYIKNGEDYYYGDTRTFKTRSQEDPDVDPIPDPDPDPNPVPDSIPLAITGDHYNETSTTATIECQYENIPAGAECGYYLYGWKGNTIISSISSSFGNAEGDKVTELTGLKPSTTYYYQAYVHYKGKEYTGGKKSFNTLTPNAVTGECFDVTSDEATIICTYYNVPSGATTGVKLSYNGQTDYMPYSYGDGEHSIDILNLYPGTTYTYSAYIKYEDEYYEGEDKQFTTLTPSAYVGEATDVKEETAQFEYGFHNVPTNGTCHITLKLEGGEIYEYPVQDTQKDVFQLSRLQPSTTYTYWSHINYYGEKWESETKSFTTKARPKPSAITGEYLEVTENSAVVKCSYNNAQNLNCGVTVIGGGDTLNVTTESSDGEREISITGLSPATTYTYCAYVVDVDGITYFGEDKTFTTDLPDVSGMWTCKEKRYKSNGAEYYKTYTVTLHKDGTATTSEFNYISAQWSQSKTGLFVKFITGQPVYNGHYWTGSDMGYQLSIKFDDPTNPISGKGRTNQYAVSVATGLGSENYYDLEMTR